MRSGRPWSASTSASGVMGADRLRTPGVTASSQGMMALERGRRPMARTARFHDRAEAGRAVGALVADRYGGRPAGEVVVLGLPRGGVPVAAEVARAIGAPLDVFVVRKVGVPGQPELAMGAVASGGTRVLNDDVIRMAGRHQGRARAGDRGRAGNCWPGARPPTAATGRPSTWRARR